MTQILSNPLIPEGSSYVIHSGINLKDVVSLYSHHPPRRFLHDSLNKTGLLSQSNRCLRRTMYWRICLA